MQLTDAMNEAKDTHRYLKRLDGAWEPLYQDLGINQMQQLLPGLISSIRTMQTVYRCPRLVLPTAVTVIGDWLMLIVSNIVC